jgi:hypothetical protein
MLEKNRSEQTYAGISGSQKKYKDYNRKTIQSHMTSTFTWFGYNEPTFTGGDNQKNLLSNMKYK